MRGRRAGAVAGIILATAPAAAPAQDSFLTIVGPVEAGHPINLRIASGSFPSGEGDVPISRITRISARAAETRLQSTPTPTATTGSLILNWPEATPPHQNGVEVAIDLSPLDIRLGPDELERWLAEIEAPSDMAALAHAALARDGILHLVTVSHLKLMACAALCDGLAPARPVGATLEFVASEEAWQLLRQGQPIAGQAVFATNAAQGRRRLTTDRQGRVLLPADRIGPVLLEATVLTPPTEPNRRFVSERTVLTLDPSVR